MGAYFIRGDNVALVSKVELKIKPGTVYGDPIAPMNLS